MSLERELQALKKRVQRIGFQESPPELGIILTIVALLIGGVILFSANSANVNAVLMIIIES